MDLDGSWSNWESLGSPANSSPCLAITALSGREHHQEVFVIGSAGELSHRWHYQDDDWAKSP